MLRYTVLRYTVLRYTVLRYTVLRYTVLRYTVLSILNIFYHNNLCTHTPMLVMLVYDKSLTTMYARVCWLP